MLYFDSAAAELPHPKLAEWYAELNEEIPFNPHGGTCYAELAMRRIISAENTIKEIIQTDSCHIVWTSGITEALNLAVHSFPGLQVEKSAHPALMQPAMQHRNGNKCTGFAISHVNSETGAINDLTAARHKAGDAILLVDGAQSFCKIPVAWREAHIDMLALSSRKIGGPAAVGALLVRNGIKLKPQIIGGGQQQGCRAGTMDAIGIALFAKVAAARAKNMTEYTRHLAKLNQAFWQQLAASKLTFIRISPENGFNGIAMFALPGYDGAVIARILADKEEILLSSASACTAETGKPSPSLIASTGSEAVARSAIRVSFSSHNTLEDIPRLISALERTILNF